MNSVGTHIDPPAIVELLKNLVRIDSVNPTLANGGKGETEIANYIADFMRQIGLQTEVKEIQPGRPNVIGVLKGTGDGPKLMLNGHMDTVGVDYMESDPLNPVVKEGRLYGRGSYDMKGGLAAILTATKALVESGKRLKGDLVIAGVCDEEYASIGTEKVANECSVDATIVAEPTDLQIVIAHKGFAWIDVETRGIAAHGSRPDIGVDAIAKMGKILVEIEKLQENVLQSKLHELVGSPSIHASIIQGGRELSTYPDHCKLQLERRLIPGEDSNNVDSEINAILGSLKRGDPTFDGKYRITFLRDPMEVPKEERICQVLQKNVRDITGFTPNFVGIGGWLDTQIMWKRGIPAIAFGPSGEGAHASIEYVDIDSVTKAAHIFERAATEFCGSAVK
jgi:acetylornithine deacetylase